MAIRAENRNFLWETVKNTAPERNGFDLSFEYKMTCNAGVLNDFLCKELLPNDDFEIGSEQFVRLQPMISPTMHRMSSYFHYFYVPNRLLWNHWEEFISRGNGKKLPPNQSYTPPEKPKMSLMDILLCSPSNVGTYSNPVPASWCEHEFLVNGVTFVVRYLELPKLCNQLQIPYLFFPISYNYTGESAFPTFQPVSEDATLIDFFQLSYLTSLLQSNYIDIMQLVAYKLIWQEFYRDENVGYDYSDMLEYFRDLTGVPDFSSDTEFEYCRELLTLELRAWEKDYFTTATLLPQKAPDVEIPISMEQLQATISAQSSAITGGQQLSFGQTYTASDGTIYNTFRPDAFMTGGQVTASPRTTEPWDLGLETNNGTQRYKEMIISSPSDPVVSRPLFDRQKMYVDGSNFSLNPDALSVDFQGSSNGNTTVANVRRAFAIQRLFEALARTGTRYIETLLGIFSSDAGDARLQRPEYVGGTSTPVSISEVVQTSESQQTPQGNLAGYGLVTQDGENFHYHSPEHGFLIGLFSILPRTSYSQGLPRSFTRETWLDYPWPQLEHIGEQAVYSRELFLQAPMSSFSSSSTSADEIVLRNFDEVFGYQSRYSDWKYSQDFFGGDFAQSLLYWTLGRTFAVKPTLSEKFVSAVVSERNFAVVNVDDETDDTGVDVRNSINERYNEDKYLCDIWFDFKKVTCLTLYSEPI